MSVMPWCVIALALASPVAAQVASPCTTPAKTYQDYWCAQLQEIKKVRDTQGAQSQIERLIGLAGGNLRAFLLYAQAHAQSLDLAPVEDARTDKQVAAPAGTGSTSLVSKGAVPAILGFAVENGALTQSTTGTTVTLRGNLVGWLDLVQNQGFIASYQDDSPVVRQLRRVSYSLTLNTDTGEAADVDASAGGGFSPDAIREQLRQARQQLAGYSVRVALFDRRDPRAAVNRGAVANLLDTAGVAVLKSDNFLSPVLNSDEYNFRWIPQTASRLSDPTLSDAALTKVLFQQLEDIRLQMVNEIENFDEQVAQALLAIEGFDKARLKVFQAMQTQPLVAFEYVKARPADLPGASTFRFIAEGQFGSHLDLTANVAWTVQHKGTVTFPEPTPISGLRDFQAAAQLEVPLGSLASRLSSTSGIGAPVLGVAYLSQKLTERAAVAFAGNSFTLEPGWVHALQAKVTVPVKGSGVKMPFSITVANRSELIEEKVVRGQIGLTFDLDVLSALRR